MRLWRGLVNEPDRSGRSQEWPWASEGNGDGERHIDSPVTGCQDAICWLIRDQRKEDAAPGSKGRVGRASKFLLHFRFLIDAMMLSTHHL